MAKHFILHLVKALSLILLASLLAAACGQSPAQAKPSKKPAAASAKKPASGPLTYNELHSTINKVEVAVRRIVLKQSQMPPAKMAKPDRTAKRTEILAEFWRLYGMASPHFKFTPRAETFEPKHISLAASDPLRKPVEKMIRMGFIGKVAPLATSKESGMSLEEYGDALGYFVARLSDLTHTPSARWSPYLFGHKEGF